MGELVVCNRCSNPPNNKPNPTHIRRHRTELLGTRQRKGTEAMDPSQSSAGAAERERRRSGSPPPASTIAALEYQAWLRGVNEHMGVFKHLNPDEVFGTAANEMRLRVAAHVLLLKKQLDTSYAEGLRNLHGDVQELAERAGAWHGVVCVLGGGRHGMGTL